MVLAEVAPGALATIFDSDELPGDEPTLPHLRRLSDWRTSDLDGDGDLDLLGRVDDSATGRTTLYAFDGNRRAYTPLLVTHDVPIEGGGIDRTEDGTAVFRFRLSGMEEEAALAWAEVRHGVFLTARPDRDAADAAAHGADDLHAATAPLLRAFMPEIDLSRFETGLVIRVDHPSRPQSSRIFVEWLGRDALAVERGGTPERDRKKVRKIRVVLSSEGDVIDVIDTSTWLARTGMEADAGSPSAGKADAPLDPRAGPEAPPAKQDTRTAPIRP
jgi:hypothetical protein